MKSALRRKILTQVVAVALCGAFAGATQAASISIPASGTGFWTYTGPGTLVDLSGSGDFSDSFTLASPTIVKIVADDCCVTGDQFGLILDSSSTAWSYTDFTSSISGPGLFHGEFTGLLAAGTHSFSLEVTADCCGSGGMDWNVSAVPEPETYAMLLAGLGILGFAARRKQQKV